MSAGRAPAWFDRSGMEAWASGMARAVRRRVRIVDLEGRELVAAGQGEGNGLRLPIEVNGAVSGFVEVVPGELPPAVTELVELATHTLRALAEVRFSMTDLVRTTARQWRELSVLYRSSELMGGWQEPAQIATSLAEKARRAVRARAAIVLFSVCGAPHEAAVAGEGGEALLELARWGSELDEPCLASSEAELRRRGFTGAGPDAAAIVEALRVRKRTHGALVLIAGDHIFGAEELKLATLLAGQAALGFANLELIEEVREAERFQHELEMAASIQESILPPEQLDLGWLEMAATCRPAAWVGGDAFLAIPQADGRVLVGVADVSGHGLSSALLMNGFATAVRALAGEAYDPSHVAAAANELVTERVGDMGMFVTAAFASLAPGGRLAVANAGHPPVAVVAANGEIRLLEATGMPLGILPGEEFPLVEADIQVGGFLVAYSDGVTEARSPDGAMFGIDGLERALARLSPAAATAGELRDLLLAELEQFRGEGPLTDDLTLLVIRRTA